MQGFLMQIRANYLPAKEQLSLFCVKSPSKIPTNKHKRFPYMMPAND
jgi:hypothetical protein